jgi:tRNA-guanine family transglycosylase
MNELSAHRLLTIHNLTYVLELVAGARSAIETGGLESFVESTRSRRLEGSTYLGPVP